MRARVRRRASGRSLTGTQFTCYASIKVQIRTHDVERPVAAGQVLSLLALLVQKYKHGRTGMLEVYVDTRVRIS